MEGSHEGRERERERDDRHWWWWWSSKSRSSLDDWSRDRVETEWHHFKRINFHQFQSSFHRSIDQKTLTTFQDLDWLTVTQADQIISHGLQMMMIKNRERGKKWGGWVGVQNFTAIMWVGLLLLLWSEFRRMWLLSLMDGTVLYWWWLWGGLMIYLYCIKIFGYMKKKKMKMKGWIRFRFKKIVKCTVVQYKYSKISRWMIFCRCFIEICIYLTSKTFLNLIQKYFSTFLKYVTVISNQPKENYNSTVKNPHPSSTLNDGSDLINSTYILM